MKCPQCQSDVPAGEQFCLACGTEMTNVTPVDANNTATAATQVSTQTGDALSATSALATLTYDGKNIPLNEGSRVIIAREDTDRCKPDLPIKGGSGTPVEVTVENGQIMVHDTGTSIGTRVVVYLKPGDSMPLKPGDMLMLGDQVVSVG